MPKPKNIVLVAEGCPACAEVKEQLGKNKNYEILDVTTNDKALRLARKLGVTGVPTFLVTRKNGQVCALKDDGTVDKCIEKPTKK
jgi:glutaredoxin-related protein